MRKRSSGDHFLGRESSEEDILEESLLNSHEDNENHREEQHTTTLQIPLFDESGSAPQVIKGLIFLAILGMDGFGLVLPKNNALPIYYKYASAAIGYTYFVYWSVSFYPQVFMNFKHQNTNGLSVDFCWLNVLGFTCYASYNAAFFFSPLVQRAYATQHDGSVVTVQSNDVAFAIHALLLSCVTVFQIGYYNGMEALEPSWGIGWVLAGLVSMCMGSLLWMLLQNDPDHHALLDFLYLISFAKIAVSLLKYIPQVLLNYRRKSTSGWSIWNILLDFSGGLLSNFQLVLDCVALKDWTGITGNPAKWALGFVSILFDIIFILQHYVLYADKQQAEQQPTRQEEEQQQPLNHGEGQQ
eukprot:CAMPEP_0116860798 /NCGR_PEP_ID=MMETSP0418-20121206/22631_1 /TAXON_ID=1158023 /ORGANISM="Astrosyne radiata, Strain 13vi08-1A" /LENGTH=354 /DNA_ID=CAMNT_0004495277 /DNA_START=248 /DNA_END=1316 /DNA_ORIENTATION=-